MRHLTSIGSLPEFRAAVASEQVDSPSVAMFCRHRTCARPFVLPTIASIIAGCTLLSDPVYCTGSIEPGIVARITEIGSGRPLAAGARGTVRDGGFVDSLLPHGFILDVDSIVMITRSGANERAGEYHIDVLHPGYSPVSLPGIRVDRGSCHVNTRIVEVPLTPRK